MNDRSTATASVAFAAVTSRITPRGGVGRCRPAQTRKGSFSTCGLINKSPHVATVWATSVVISHHNSFQGFAVGPEVERLANREQNTLGPIEQIHDMVQSGEAHTDTGFIEGREESVE
jgi:hypothetical protein